MAHVLVISAYLEDYLVLLWSLWRDGHQKRDAVVASQTGWLPKIKGLPGFVFVMFLLCLMMIRALCANESRALRDKLAMIRAPCANESRALCANL